MKRLVLLLLLAAAGPATAESPVELYNQGNQFYKEGKFTEAREAYRKACAAGLAHPDLFYNLGNAELKSGNLGPAVAAYLRAKRLNPRDPDLNFNLEYARKKIAAKLPEIPRGPFSRAFSWTAGLLSADEWTIFLFGAWWLAGLAAAAAILAQGPFSRRLARIILYFALAGFAAALPFTVSRLRQDVFTERAVIVAEKVTARSGPGEENAALFELVPGMDLVMGQCQSGWCRVSTSAGFIGWVPAEAFERL